jgi:hypothetical protein
MGVQYAEPRSTATRYSNEVQQRGTATRYSNAIGFDRASVCSNAQIRAQTSLDNRHAPSSQVGGHMKLADYLSRWFSGRGYRNRLTNDFRLLYLAT